MEKAITIKQQTFAINTPQRAKQMAIVLTKFIKENHLSVNIQGHEYAMVEGWQFAGGLLKLFPKITEVKEIGPMRWFSACEIINTKTNQVVSNGFALCSKEEAKKKGFDEYAILSQAQTRSIGKAFRNYIGWLIKMAGYEGTPAEEMKTAEAMKEKATKSNATNYLEQLKAEVYKAGAKSEEEAVKMINKKTGMTLKDLKITEKNAQMVLFAYLNVK